MKEALIIFSMVLGVAAAILLLIPWIAEYAELYFGWVRSHFTH